MTRIPKNAKVIEKHYGSITELVKSGMANNTRYEGRYGLPDSWAGGKTFDEVEDITLRGGIESDLDEAKKLIDKIEANVSVLETSWEPNVMGAFPIVPDYLTGNPMCMMDMVQTEKQGAPVRVWAEGFLSSGNTHQQTLNKVAGICALAMALQQHNPVEIILFDYIWMEKERKKLKQTATFTAPVDIAQLAAVISKRFVRTLLFNSWHDGTGAKNSNCMYPALRDSKEPEKKARKLFNMADNDVVIMPNSHGGKDFKAILNNPIDWVKDELRKQGMA